MSQVLLTKENGNKWKESNKTFQFSFLLTRSQDDLLSSPRLGSRSASNPARPTCFRPAVFNFSTSFRHSPRASLAYERHLTSPFPPASFSREPHYNLLALRAQLKPSPRPPLRPHSTLVFIHYYFASVPLIHNKRLTVSRLHCTRMYLARVMWNEMLPNYDNKKVNRHNVRIAMLKLQ